MPAFNTLVAKSGFLLLIAGDNIEYRSITAQQIAYLLYSSKNKRLLGKGLLPLSLKIKMEIEFY